MTGTIRSAKQTDLKLIFDSWQKSFKKSDMTHKMPGQLFCNRMEQLILALMKKGAKITIMADPADEDYIFSWICHSTLGNLPVLHYVWTKTTFREYGFCRQLMNHVGINGINPFIYTSRAPMARILERDSKTFKAGTYDPFIQWEMVK